MKKAILVLVALLVIGAVAMAGCINITVPSSSSSPTSSSEPMNDTAEELNIIGTWAGVENGITINAIFNKDGTASVNCYAPPSYLKVDDMNDYYKELSYYGNFSMIGKNSYVISSTSVSASTYGGQSETFTDSYSQDKFAAEQISPNKIKFKEVNDDDEDSFIFTKI